MNNYNHPYLEKYTGKASRHKCPACNSVNSFAYYLDGNTGQMIHGSVGRCNHESACGYHYTPKQYFIDNPEERSDQEVINTHIKKRPHPIKPDYIPFKYVDKSASYQSNFVHFLCGLFDRHSLESPTIERIMSNYALGATKNKAVIFWQIDASGKVRTGKVMQYRHDTGRRIKDAGGINWVHSVMKKQGLLPDNFNLVQCLFGEHLLTMYPSKVVALVESEKSALIASGVYPEYIWLATGGKSQLSIEKLRVLQGRTVVMFPDVDAFEYWQAKAKDLESIGCRVVVSAILEINATPSDRESKIDIADWLIRELSAQGVPAVREGISSAENALKAMQEKNPAIGELIDAFGLVLINN